MTKILEKFDLLQYLNPIILSGDVGVQKPNPLIFELLLKKARISDKSDVVHVGDHQEKDYNAAISFGIKGILLSKDNGGSDGEDNIVRISLLKDLL